MQLLKSSFINKFKTIIVFIQLNLLTLVLKAQTPTHIPRDRSEPVNFFDSVENIVFFIVIPVLIVIFYLLWRRNLRKQREEQEKNNKE